MYSIASWNIRGMNFSPKQTEVRQVINENKLSVCANLESHISVSNLDRICSIVFPHWNWTSNVHACDKNSRIIIGWDPNIADLMVLSLSDQVIHSQITFKADQKVVFCSFVYAHNLYTQRRALWNNLGMHKAFVHDKPWVLLGDFNAALFLDDKVVGSSNVDISMREFKDCVEDLEISDVNRSGLQFTWNQKPRGKIGILKKLDRIMANQYFLADFVGAHALFQPFRLSDHAPAILCFPMVAKFQPKPFKFANVLVHHDKFNQVVSECWNTTLEGHHMYVVVKKLKLLKKPLRKLLYDKGHLFDKVVKLRSELDDVHKAVDNDPLNVSLREEEAVRLQAFNEAILDEERFLKQKAKINWLKVGDSNSAYFHKVVKARKARNRIDSVVDGLGNRFDGSDVPTAFVSHYRDFLGSPGVISNLDTSELFSNKLTSVQADLMIRNVTSEEVRLAMFDMGDDKAPGPDGFNSAFFKHSWSIIGRDVVRAVQDFFHCGKLLKEVNHTIISLLPKVAAPSRITDYRPISLCNVLFKCITKIIANRISESLTGLVGINQSAFISGRSISDNILLTQELMHNYHLDRGVPRCALKVDIQKAYDTVDWRFLKRILIEFGFHPKMVHWIMTCVATASYSVCINGNLHGFFPGKRGLRQGDPLSPYLFTLVMEVLTLMLKKRVRESASFTFHLKCEELEIINLCFADDLIIFMHADVNSARVIMEALEEFKDASGLAPSIPKSTAYFCNVLNHVKLSILSVLPFEEGRLPVKYLGVPLVSTRLVYRDCNELVEKLEIVFLIGRINLYLLRVNCS